MSSTGFKSSVLKAWNVATPWTLLLSAAEQHQESLERLLCIYADPIYSYYRRNGLTRADAEDLTQHVITEFFVVKKNHHAISQIRGRFRDFLLAVAKNAMLDWRKRCRTQRRGGNLKCFSLEQMKEQWAHWEPEGQASAEEEFERQWAASTWLAALELFRARQPRELAEVLEILYGGDNRPTQQEASISLGISVACLNSRLYKARRRLFECIEEIVESTVENKDELHAELNRLRDILAASGMNPIAKKHST